MPTYLNIPEAPKTLQGTVDLPSSKSLSNRALIFEALAKHDLNLQNLSHAQDTQLLKSLLASEEETLDCHNSGTVMRFLAAYFAIKKGRKSLTGHERMKERPIGELVSALSQLGASIKYLERKGYPPIEIHGKPLKGGMVELDASISSQFVTALLLIAPFTEKGIHLKFTGIPVSRPYFMMTVKMLEYYNVKVNQQSNEIQVKPKTSIKPKSLAIEGDWTAAANWMALATVFSGSNLQLKPLLKSSWQGDQAIVDFLFSFGLETKFGGEKKFKVISHDKLPDSLESLMTDHPDLVQTMAVLCTLHQIPFVFQGLQSLRIKETDRIEALKHELQKTGAQVHAGEDYLSCEHYEPLPTQPIYIKTYEDHRMAMSFGLMAAKHSNVLIENPEVVHKSYPNFWESLANVGFKTNLQKA